MNRRTLLGAFAPSKFGSNAAGRPDYFRAVLEPLENRQLLSVSTLSWVIDAANSTVTNAMPDQTTAIPIGSDSDAVILRWRDQMSGSGSLGSWTTGNTSSLAGTMAIDYVDGSSIQFMTNDPTNFPNPQGVYSNISQPDTGSYFPDPTTFVPDSPGGSQGSYSPFNSTAPQGFAARINATLTYPLTIIPNLLTVPTVATFDLAYLSLAQLQDDFKSPAVSITAGTFPVTTTNLGVGGQLRFDGLNIVLTQIPSFQQSGSGVLGGTNLGVAGTITSTGPLTRKATIPLNIPISFSDDSVTSNPLTGVITGQIVASVTLQAPVVDLNGDAAGVTFTNLWSGAGPVNVAGAAADAPNNAKIFADTVNMSLLKISMATFHTGDVLSATTVGGIAQTFTAGSPGTPGTLTLSGSDSVTNYETVLESVKYNNTAGGPGVASVVVKVTSATDSLAQVSTDVSSTITISVPVNTPPVVDLSVPGGSIDNTSSFNGATAVNIADGTASVTDDGGTLASIKVVLNSPHTGDVLAATTTGSIVQSFVNNTLTLSGTDSVTNYQTVLRSVTYNNTALGGPGVASETANVVANDGTFDSTPIAVATININNPPVVDLNGAGGGTGNTSTWVGVGPVAISDPTATVTDALGTNLASIKITLNSPHTGDVLAATTTGSITQSFVNNTLTLSGSDSIANYQTVLRSVTYDNPLGGQGVDVETANVVANDGTVNGNTAVATINMPPTIVLTVGAGSPNFTTSWYNNGGTGNNGSVPIENMAQATMNSPSGVTTITSMTVKMATFHTGDVLAVPILPGIVAITTSYSNGTLVLSGSDTVANYQKELRFVNYNNTAGGPGTSPVLITFTASDGTLSSTPVTATVNISVASGQVLGNRLFYNNSKYDSNNTAIGASDDLAIASDKIGFSGTGLSNFSAVSGFNKGITGIMVDLASGLGTHSNINLTSGDVTFKISPVTFVTTTFNQLSTWTAAPGAANISVRLGAGVGGSDRLEITWANLKITNTWLEVNVKSDASTGHTNTGLSADNVFYFASVIGNAGVGDTTALSKDDANDFSATGNNIIGVTTPVWNVMDYTKDFKVDANDGTVNTNNVFTLRYITNPTGPFAPDAGPSASPAAAASPAASTSSSAAVAAGLNLSSLPTALPSWLSGSLHNILDSQPVAKLLQNLKHPSSTQINQAIDQVTEKLHLNEDLLDGLLADLGLPH